VRFSRRKLLRFATCAVALPAVSRIAWAQAYPSRSVRIVVPFPPAGAATVLANLISPWLSNRLGQPFVVDHRPGESTNIGTREVVRAPADGHTLLLASATMAINASLYDKLDFNFARDIAPVAGINLLPNALLANPSLPAKTVTEVIAYAKSNPGKISYASSGNGTVPHVLGELFRMMAGVDIIHRPYPGMGPALIDVADGRVDVAFAPLSVAIEFIRGGKLRPLAVTSASRRAVLPETPTMLESVAGFEASGWQGICAPRKTPNEIVERLNKEINVGLADPTLKAELEQGGTTIIPGSAADFGRLIADDIERWAKVIKFAAIKAE
jgi:tripartite-type tricarboxylate transporter receptor subunit TctC